MRSQREIYQSLLDGNMLISFSGDKRTIDVVTGFLVDETGRKAISYFDKPDSWSEYSEYKEPQWYDKIPEDGIICWSWRQGNKDFKSLVIIEKTTEINGKKYFVTFNGFILENSEPVKPEECYQGEK
jgi:hypothetical protein